MTSSKHRVFDFREIAALDDTAVILRNWVSKASSFFSDFWNDAAGYGAQVSLGAISTESYATLLEGVPKENVCCLAEIGNYAWSMWFVSAEDLRLIASELLCLPEVSELGDGDLSPVELYLAKLFVDRLADSLSDGWLGEEQVRVNATDLEKDPRKTRIFRAKDLVSRTSVQVDLKARTVVIHWLLPKQKTCDLLETSVDRRKSEEPVCPSPDLIEQLPIEIACQLGKATMPMTKLSALHVGQLILLDQRIDQPVTAFINESPVYACWPGRIGKQQALEIASCLND